MFGLSPDELIEKMLADNKYAKRLDIILRALQDEMLDKHADVA